MLAILPATATMIGLIVLGQVPTLQDILGIGLVIAGVALHQERQTRPASPDTELFLTVEP
jgi:inner membrane transporter RhtA